VAAGALDAGAVQIGLRNVFWRRFRELHGICLSRPLGYRAVAAGLAMTLLSSAIAENAASARAKKPDLPNLARQARKLLMEGRTVQFAAKTLGVSYLTLYRNFKQATGLSPKEYAREIRLAHAEDLLACTDLSVKEIAGRLGYYSASHLSLEFKMARGIAPSLWPGRRH